MDRFRDASGLFAVAGHAQAARRVAVGLGALAHRGGGGASCAAADEDGVVRAHHGAGTPADVLGPIQSQALIGRFAIGQVHRVPDPGATLADALEPTERLLCARVRDSRLAVAVNGRFTNGATLRREVVERGGVFHGATDAELLLHLLAVSPQRTLVNRLVDALWRVEGGYAVLLLAAGRVVAVRDPRGLRPLVLGRVDDGLAFASEDQALRAAGGEVRRELRPGEMIVADGRGVQSLQPFVPRTGARCVQEVLSVARNDGAAFGLPVWRAREELGLRLGGLLEPGLGQVIIPLGDRAEAVSVGLSRRAALPVARALIADGDRWIAIPGPVQGRTVILAATHLAQGDELAAAVSALRTAGAASVHLRIASPPVRVGCRFGVVGPTTDELVRASDPAAAAVGLGADTVAWLPDLGEQLGGEGWCRACLGEASPVPPESDDQLTLF